MSYYPTIFEDLQRARELLAKRALYGADLHAAHKLLESFVDEVDNYQLLLAIMGASDYRTAVRRWRAAQARDPMPEDPRLYDAAREACHACGLPWTDPRTGIKYEPP